MLCLSMYLQMNYTCDQSCAVLCSMEHASWRVLSCVVTKRFSLHCCVFLFPFFENLVVRCQVGFCNSDIDVILRHVSKIDVRRSCINPDIRAKDKKL